MNIKILNLTQITKEIALSELESSEKLETAQIDEYLDILSAINRNQFVYNMSTSNGDFILYITARESKF